MDYTLMAILAILVCLFFMFGIPYLGVQIITIVPRIKGVNKLNELRSYRPEVLNVLFELNEIAEETLKMSEAYVTSCERAKSNPILKFALIGEQMKLESKMNHNVFVEWIPRFKYLKEQQDMFRNDSILYNAFNEFKKTDKVIRELKLPKLTSKQLYASFKKTMVAILTTAAITSMLGVAALAGIGSAIQKGGKDIGNYPKSTTRYRDDDGNLYDENNNRVPY